MENEEITGLPEPTAEQIAAQMKAEAAERNKRIDRARQEVDLQVEHAAATRPAVERTEPLPPMERHWSDSYPAIFASHAKDVLIDAPVEGTTAFVTETFIAAKDFARWVLPADKIINGFRNQKAEGEFSLDAFERGMGASDQGNAEFNEDLRRARDDNDVLSPQLDNPVAQIEASMIQFIEGFIPVAKVMQTTSNLTRLGRMTDEMAAAALTSAIVFDPKDPNLANLVETVGDEQFSNAVTEFLSTDPGDPDSLNRLRNAAAEAVTGPLAEAFVGVLRAGKAAIWKRQADEVAEKLVTAPDPIKIEADNAKIEADLKADMDAELRAKGEEGAAMADEAADTRNVEEIIRDTGPKRANARPDEAPAIVRPKLTNDSIREGFQEAVTEDVREQLIEAVSKGEYLRDDMGLFNNSKFDLGDVESREQLLAMMGTIEEITLDTMQKTGRAVRISHEQTLKYAEALGHNAEQAHQLAQDVIGDHRLSARMLAGFQTMVANGKRMRTLIEKARRTGADLDKVEANRAIELQAAIMMELKGAQSEVARTMNAMRLMRAAGEESFEELASAAREFGVRSELIEGMLKGKNSLADVNRAAEQASRATIPEMVAEVAVNGLLTNPTTHSVNLSSNAAMAIIAPYERFMASLIGKGRTALGIGQAERHLVTASLRDMAARVQNIMLAFRLAGKAFVDGAPITDIKQRVEVASRPRITARSLGLDGNAATKALIDNVVAPAIRLPTRLLSAEDEFFKTIHYRGSLSASAYETAIKHADRKGLTGEARAAFIKKREKFLVENPTVKMQRDAIDEARRGTFQEEAQTSFGPKVERVINAHPFLKLVVAPFYRTPTNILRQTFVDRVPVLNLFIKKNRDAIKAGGREGDMALARLTTGVGAMTTGYLLVNQWSGEDKAVEIVGKRDYSATGRFDKVDDYSIRIGTEWYRFNRFDPVGSWLGFAADYKAIMDSRYDPADPEADKVIMDYVAASTGAVMRNALNKVWLKSISDIVETLGRVESSSPASAQRAMERLIADQVIKVVPYSSALRAVTKQVDPVAREAWTVADRVFQILPGGSDGLAPKRDELGRIIEHDRGAHYLFSPFAASVESKDPLDVELASLDFQWQRLDKSLENGKVPLNTEQYSRFKFLIGQTPPLPGMPTLEEALRQLIDTELYQRETTSNRVNFINEYREAYRQIAAEKLKDEYPELRERSSHILVNELEKTAGRRLDHVRQLLGIAE